MILKICGLTNQEDTSRAIEAGATAVGFNFYRRSPRYISPEQAAEIVTPEGVRRVGVFVNERRERMQEIARTARLDVAQLHGDEGPADYPSPRAACAFEGDLAAISEGVDKNVGPGGLPASRSAKGASCATNSLAVWKALRVGDGFDIAPYRDDPAEALLLDGPAADLYGGSGRSFDWALVRETNRKIVLAGGLDGSNVAMAIECVRPWGVDACSRIERAPGKKDYKKMSEFLQAAKAAARA